MRTLAAMIIAGGVFVTSACDSIFCSQQSLSYDLVPGSSQFELQRTLKDEAIHQGYTCTESPIKDVNGTDIGSHFACVKKC
jgi:hypothetical protein